MILPIYFTNQNRLDSNTEIVNLLTKILNSSYTSGIDKLLSYGETASGNIVGEFDGDGTRFQYLINTTANTISYNSVQRRKDHLLANLDAAKKVKIGAQTAANKSGKKLTCTPGKTYPCGAVCRAMNKPCRQQMNLQTQTMTKQVVAKIATPPTPNAVSTKTVSAVGEKTGKITAQKLTEQIAKTKVQKPSTGKESTNQSKIIPKLINTKRIELPTQEFDEKDLRAAAEASLELGGFIEPPIVRRAGNLAELKYEVVSGHFQIAAAIVARAIDPIRGETINAVVIEEENEAAIKKQMKAQKLSKQESPKVSGYSQQQIQEIAEQLKGEKPNFIPVYVKNINLGVQQKNAYRNDPNEEDLMFNPSEFGMEETIGQVFRGVTKLIKNKEDKPNARYEYEAVLNGHILEASRLAKNDFIRIMIIDDEMEKQLKFESGQSQ